MVGQIGLCPGCRSGDLTPFVYGVLNTEVLCDDCWNNVWNVREALA